MRLPRKRRRKPRKPWVPKPKPPPPPGKCGWTWIRSPYGTWSRKRICTPGLPKFPIVRVKKKRKLPSPPKVSRPRRPRPSKPPRERKPFVPAKRVPLKGTRSVGPRVREKSGSPLAVYAIYPSVSPIHFPDGASHRFDPACDVLVGMSSYERIEDVRGARASWQNPCVHEEIHCFIDSDAFQRNYIGDNTLSKLNLADVGPFVPRNAIHMACGLPSPADVSEASIWARTRSISAVDESVDALAFFGELLSDLNDFLGKCTRFATQLGNLQDKVISKFHEIRRKRPGLTDLACWHLAWVFGVKPMLGDLEKMAHGLTNAMQRHDWLCDRNTIPTYVKNRRKLDCQSGELASFLDEGALFGMGTATDLCIGYSVEVDSSEATFASTQCVRYMIDRTLMEKGDSLGRGAVWLHYLGVYNPIASAWELTKFSWLVDWFIGYKNRVTARLLSFSPLKDADYLGSVSSLRTVHRGRINQLIGESGDIRRVQVGSFIMEYYQRIPGDFSVEYAPQFRLPLAFEQWAIALSLGVQRFSKRK